MRIPILQDQERRRTALRVIGLVVGLGFFAAAIRFAMGEQAEFAKALEALRDPPPGAVALVLRLRARWRFAAPLNVQRS